MSSKLIGQFHLNNNRSEAKFLSDPIFYVHDLFLGSGSKTFVLANFSLMPIFLQPRMSKNTTQMVIFEFKAKIISDINNIRSVQIHSCFNVVFWLSSLKISIPRVVHDPTVKELLDESYSCTCYQGYFSPSLY